MSQRDIVSEVRAVDAAFDSLKGGRELDERMHDLIEGRAPLAIERRTLWRRIAMLTGAGALAIALFFAVRSPVEDVVASLTTPSHSTVPAPVVDDSARAPQVAHDAAPLPLVVHEDGARAPRETAPAADTVAREGVAPSPSPASVARAPVDVPSDAVRARDVPLDPRTRARLESTSGVPVALTSVVDDPAAAMAHLKELRARGAWHEVLSFTTEWQTRTLDARTAETVSFEHARALVKLARTTEACRALSSHVARFPSGAEDAAALSAQLACE